MASPSSPLSRRQQQVMTLLCDGLTYKQIARTLGLSANTVSSHVHAILERVGAVNATHAAVVCVRNGWDVEDGDVRAPTPQERERYQLDAGPERWLTANTGDDPLSRLIEDLSAPRR